VSGLLSVEPVEAARWTGVALLAVTTAVAVAVVRRATGSPARAGLAGALLVGPNLVLVSAMAWSEPPLLALTALRVGALVAWMRTQSTRWVLALVVCCGAAPLQDGARGVAVLSVRRAWWPAVLVAAASAVPLGLWLARTAAVSGQAGGKRPGVHPYDVADLLATVRTAGGWVLPVPVSGGDSAVVAVGLAVTGVVVVALLLRGPRGRGRCPTGVQRPDRRCALRPHRRRRR
jgi:hypothetical protein